MYDENLIKAKKSAHRRSDSTYIIVSVEAIEWDIFTSLAFLLRFFLFLFSVNKILKCIPLYAVSM